MDIRRSFLKGYFFAVLQDGGVRISDGPLVMARKIYDLVKEDGPAVAVDIVAMAAQFKVKEFAGPFADFIGSKIAGFAADVDKNGFGKAFKKVTDVYWQGVDANARARKR